jgi:hypothetical protein
MKIRITINEPALKAGLDRDQQWLQTGICSMLLFTRKPD